MTDPEDLPPLDLQVIVEAPQELNHSSFVLAGLFELEHLGLIGSVRVRPSLNLRRGEVEVLADGDIRRSEARARKSLLAEARMGARRVPLCFDLRDATMVYPDGGLTQGGVLFKRSFDRFAVSVAQAHFPAIVEPAGLSLAVRSPYTRQRVQLGLGYALPALRDAVRIDRRVWARLRAHVRADVAHYRRSQRHPDVLRLRTAGPGEAGDGSVLFQTRSFNRTDDPDVIEIQEQRAAIIRALRSAFGPRFVGGFVPDGLVRSRYPDCVSNVASEPASYFAAMQRASVVVYTRGLVQSAAWKLSEYLAHGKCIVGEPVRAVLPAPLVDGEVMEHFHSVDECVERCAALLEDPSARARMGQAAFEYYRAWVDPPVAVHRMLQTALEVAA